MSNIKYFKKQSRYWARKLNIGEIVLIPDGNTSYLAHAYIDEESKGILYNWRKFKGLDKDQIIELIFHEFGHLKHNYWYYGKKKYRDFDNFERVMCEYVAELQSMKWLRKNKPSHYKRLLKKARKRILSTLSYSKFNRFYFEAFSQIPEYQNGLQETF